MSERRYAVIAGGGTAGHSYLSLAVAAALVEAGVAPREIELVGSARGLDPTLLGGRGYPLTLLPGRGIRRRLDAGALLANAGALAGLAAAQLRSVALLRRLRPRVLVSVGGYAAVPVGLAAALLRIPVVLVNVDSVPGAAQRLLSRVAVASAVAFPGTPLPHAVLTGAPVRPEFRGRERSLAGTVDARSALGLPEHRPTVVVTGGSLGAGRLNDAALELAARWRDRADRTLFHVSGARNIEQVRAAAAAAALPSEGDGAGLCYRLVPFQEDMATLYEAADAAVCRAGALTVAELTVSGVPALLVPLPGAPGDHQSVNASVLVAAGAALTLSDEECDGERVAALLDPLLDDALRLGTMSSASAALGRPDADREVAALVMAHAR